MISPEEAKKGGFGSYPVAVANHYQISLPCGEHMAVKFWLPSSPLIASSFDGTPQSMVYCPSTSGDDEPASTPDKFPVIMEYLPYRKSDQTYERDFRRHSWFASHGYVVARVDMRGTGDSEGLYYGEYLSQEQDDAYHIIQWFDDQPWCNGRVGMYGKSWGGFNGLQVAYVQPPALKAVITLYSTDDRYETDIHYEGGCVVGFGMLSWYAHMLGCMNALPPDPRCVPDWRKRWRERLDNMECWVKEWLSHQQRDDFWLHGSVCTDPGRLKIPVLAIGGWRDPYHDAVFRMAESLPCVRAIIGPWSHNWPDTQCPGPTLDYLVECLQWWDCHLKGKSNGAMEAPLMRLYLRDSVTPLQSNQPMGMWPGKWVSETQWPPEDRSRNVMFVPHRDSLLPAMDDDLPQSSSTAWFKSQSGAWAGEWFGYGIGEAPGEQQLEDALSLSWTSEVLSDDVSILGFPLLKCSVKVHGGTKALMAARLCDVFPDGKSTLVSHGVLNLCHYKGHGEDQMEDLTPEHVYDVLLKLHSTSYVVPKGHRFRLAVSPNYWPLAWPSPTPANLEILTGTKKTGSPPDARFFTSLTIPTCPPRAQREVQGMVCLEPKIGPPAPMVVQREPSMNISTTSDLWRGQTKRTMVDDSGRILYKELGTIIDMKQVSTYTMEDGKPLSARAGVDWDVKLKWVEVEGGTETYIKTRSEMTSDEKNFYLKNVLHVTLNEEEVFQKTWNDTVERSFV